MKPIYFIFFLVLLSSLVLADDYYKKTETIDLKVGCYNEGNRCNSGSLCNISVTYPNGSLMVTDSNMSLIPGTTHLFNYTLPETDTLGKYTATAYCVDGLESMNKDFTFIINGTGSDNKYAFETILFLIGIITVSLVLTIFFFLSNSSLKYMFLLLTSIFSTVLVFFGWKMTEETGLAGILYSLYWVFLIITFLIFLVVLVELTIIAMNYIMQKKKAKDLLLE